MRIVSFFRLALLVSLAFACGDGASAPNAASVPIQTGIAMDGVVLLTTPDLEEVISEAHLILDGKVAFRQTYSPPLGGAAFVFPQVPVARGIHTVGIRIVSQTVSSQMYEFSGVITLSARGAEKLIMIPTTQKRLRVGESAEYKFDANF
jgi:hypothetical protein